MSARIENEFGDTAVPQVYLCELCGCRLRAAKVAEFTVVLLEHCEECQAALDEQEREEALVEVLTNDVQCLLSRDATDDARLDAVGRLLGELAVQNTKCEALVEAIGRGAGLLAP